MSRTSDAAHPHDRSFPEELRPYLRGLHRCRTSSSARRSSNRRKGRCIMRAKLFHPATLIALVALFVALSGPGFAARSVDRIVGRGTGNADTVDGFHASSKAKPRTLLALNS